jgi:hypothetical protein
MGPPPFREAFVIIMMKNPELQNRLASRNLDSLHHRDRASGSSDAMHRRYLRQPINFSLQLLLQTYLSLQSKYHKLLDILHQRIQRCRTEKRSQMILDSYNPTQIDTFSPLQRHQCLCSPWKRQYHNAQIGLWVLLRLVKTISKDPHHHSQMLPISPTIHSTVAVACPAHPMMEAVRVRSQILQIPFNSLYSKANNGLYLTKSQNKNSL